MTMENPFAPGDTVRHFKRALVSQERRDQGAYLYRIVGVATHSETRDPLMIYRALYDDGGLYARPLDMFLGPVDRVKYPQARQKWRFEKVDPTNPDGPAED